MRNSTYKNNLAKFSKYLSSKKEDDVKPKVVPCDSCDEPLEHCGCNKKKKK